MPLPGQFLGQVPQRLVVQRSGDIGSPRSSGSTSANSADRSCGLCSVAGLRPPPDFRTRPNDNGPSPRSSSKTPLPTVVALTPAASATARTPPWPNSLASGCQRQPLLALVQVRQQHLEPSGKLPTDLAGNAHTRSTTAEPKKNSLILYSSSGCGRLPLSTSGLLIFRVWAWWRTARRVSGGCGCFAGQSVLRALVAVVWCCGS